MQLLSKTTTIDFICARKIPAVLSAMLITAGIYSLSTSGLNYGIDFSGGTKVQLAYPNDVSVIDLRATLQSGGYQESVVQYFGSNKDVLIRIPLSEENSDAEVSTRIVELLNASSVGDAEVRSVEFVGPTFGKELFEKGILALVVP